MQQNINYEKLIKGYYEAERMPKGFSPEETVPGYAFNILNPSGLLYRPVIDELHLKSGGKKPVWPDGKKFAVCLTHDVDKVSLYSSRQSLRKLRYRLSQIKTPSETFRRPIGFGIEIINIIKNEAKRDPFHCYERWLEAEKNVGARSTFFFWPGYSSIKRHHYSDCFYELYDPVVFDNENCSVSEMIQEIDRRGWEIGLHPSWYSFDDIDEVKRQKDALEKTVGHDVNSIRQHYLHYDIRRTPKIHAMAGFKYDSTLGFNDNIGFRFGTCYPWHLFELESEQELSVLEIPLCIQDVSMLSPSRGMRLDEDMAFEYIVLLAESVAHVGGVLTLLWHPSRIIDKFYWSLYLKTLNYLKGENPWFATTQMIGEYWGTYCLKS